MFFLFGAVNDSSMLVFSRHCYLLHNSSDTVRRVEKGGSG